jgi:hypothetical protein
MARDISSTTIAEDAEIDRHDLVGEMEIHPAMFHKWSALMVEAQEERDHWKTKRDLLYADYDAAIRAEPEEYGIDRVTETAIKTYITAQDEYQRLQKKRLTAERKINAYTAAVRTMEHRKRMLEKMADIWLAGYYSENMTARSRSTQRSANEETGRRVRQSLNNNNRTLRRRRK